jgi:hypothetical protein
MERTVMSNTGAAGKRKRKATDKFVSFDLRRRFFDDMRGLGKKKYALGYIYWYMFLRSGKGNVLDLVEKLVMADLDMNHETLGNARRILVGRGWLKKNKHRVGDRATWTVLTTGGLTADVRKEDPADPPPPAEENEDQSVADDGFADDPQADKPPVSIGGFTAIGKSDVGTTDIGTPDVGESSKTVDLHTLGFERMMDYLADTFVCPKTKKIAWRNFSYWVSSMDLEAEPSTRRNIDAWRRAKNVVSPSSNPAFTNTAGTDWLAHKKKVEWQQAVEETRRKAKPGSHAERNPEIHTGLDANGESWAKGAIKI